MSTAPKTLGILVVLYCTAAPVHAQKADVAKFFAGAAVGLGLHESGHLILDAAFGADPGVRKISAGFIPFFAITHEPVTPVREFMISSAGFWVQEAGSEYLLTTRPYLRAEHAPAAKGLLAFNVLTSVMYAGAAFTQRGPLERDTRGIAISADVAEPWIGVVILAPAVLDATRYYEPDRPVLKWASRAVKVGGALLLLKAR